MKITDIVQTEDTLKLIDELKRGRGAELPDREAAEKGLDPLRHDVFDPIKRPDKWVKVDAEDGGKGKVVTGNDDDEAANLRREKVARVALALQKLIVKRAVAFLFGNPVELEAEAVTDKEKGVIKALKRILYDVKADSLNRRVARQVFSTTEAAELWYTVDKKHNDYGFASKRKLKVAVFSPLNGDTLYPFFDNTGDLIAFSREFQRKEGNRTIEYFETYTDEEYVRFIRNEKGWEPELQSAIEIGRIPIVYARQRELEWADVQVLIDRLEKLLSNFADTNDYHAAPKIFIEGELTGFAKKGDSGAILQGEQGTKASYLSWQHAPESVKLEINTLLMMIYTLTQTPDISFDSVKGLSAMSGVALKLLFMDAHLKVADKKEIFDEYMQRRVNIIKAFIGKMNTGLTAECQSLMVEPVITPYMIDDEKSYIDLLTVANGGKPVVSQRRSAELAGLANDTEADFEQMQEEQQRDNTYSLGEFTDV